MPVIELLGEPLHFPVDGEHQSVNCDGIEETLFGGNALNCTQRLFVLEAFENHQNFQFVDGQTLERFRVVLNDQVGNFRLSGIPRGEHELRVKERRPGRYTEGDESGESANLGSTETSWGR